METIREILAAHSSGISRPGLLAWARLRIDTAMTEAQLEEELARLGGEVVDVDGFLYLRATLDRARRGARAEAPGAWPGPASEVAPAPGAAQAVTSATPAWNRSRPGVGRGGIGRAIGVGVFLWWILSFIGGFVGDGGGATPDPTRPGDATPTIGTVIDAGQLAVGDCIVLPFEDEFSEIRRVPCDSPHGGEVFRVLDYPNLTGVTTGFPSEESFSAYVDIACRPAFASWTGTSFAEQELLEIGYFSPTEASWAAGNRTVQCYLALADGSLAGRSYRDARP